MNHYYAILFWNTSPKKGVSQTLLSSIFVNCIGRQVYPIVPIDHRAALVHLYLRPKSLNLPNGTPYKKIGSKLLFDKRTESIDLLLEGGALLVG